MRFSAEDTVARVPGIEERVSVNEPSHSGEEKLAERKFLSERRALLLGLMNKWMHGEKIHYSRPFQNHDYSKECVPNAQGHWTGMEKVHRVLLLAVVRERSKITLAGAGKLTIRG